MQRYGRDNHLVWSAEKLAVLRRGGEGGMALDVGDGVAWLERAEEAVVLGHVQAIGAEGVRLREKLLRRFRVMLVVLWNHLPSVQTTLYYLQMPDVLPHSPFGPPVNYSHTYLLTLSYCTSTIHLRELFNNTWPLPFRHTVTNWIPTAPRGEIPHFFKIPRPQLSQQPSPNPTQKHHLCSPYKLTHQSPPTASQTPF